MTSPAIGVDIVDIGRIERLIDTGGDRFLNKWFSAAEIEYCRTKAFPGRHFAARFAAKEAVVKVIPADGAQPLAWRSIEVVGTPGGAPSVQLTGRPSRLAAAAGITEIAISLSHCDTHATAVAMVLPDGSA